MNTKFFVRIAIFFMVLKNSIEQTATLTATTKRTTKISIVGNIFSPAQNDNFQLLRFVTNYGYDDYFTIRIANLDEFGDDPFISIFNNGLPTVFFVHGWLDTPFVLQNSSADFSILDENLPFQYLYYSYYFGVIPSPNFVALNWTEYFTSDYFYSINNLQPIANVIGDKLYAMAFENKITIDLSQWHFIGFSLGAHLAGLIARRIRDRSGGTFYISRITGLDPAGPLLTYPVISCFFPHLEKNDGE